MFDPEKHRVIFHDQRGCGKSTPFADTTKNTTQDLIADIELLREYLGIERMYITGGSWGSTLTLFYVLSHPERVERFMIWSVFLARQFEVDFVNRGYPQYIFPEAWERFIALVPEEERSTGNTIMEYYAGKMKSVDEKEAQKYSDEWTLWELSLCSIAYDKEKLENEVIGCKKNIAVARIETHYFMNRCFVPENYILDNINSIKHIPASAVHGRFDMCTPAVAATDLANAYCNNLDLKIVNSGHFSSDTEMPKALKSSINTNFV